MELKSHLRRAKTALVHSAGPLGLYALAWQLTRKRPRIFMYHRFGAEDTGYRVGRETFRKQIRLIRERCRLVTMAELTRVLRNDWESAAGLAVITVDDGYRDFHEHAWPILREENAPATFFPCTGFVDRELWLWPDLVEHMLELSPCSQVTSDLLGLAGAPRSWSLDDPHVNRAAWQAIIDHAIDLPDHEKWIYLRSLFSRLGVDWPESVPDRYAPASWDEIRAMANRGVEIGAHSRTHCRLTRVESEQLKDELAGAKARIEKQTDFEVTSLCYPNGAKADYNKTVMETAEASGYLSAVTAYFDGRQGGLYELRRHAVGQKIETLKKNLNGVEGLTEIAREKISMTRDSRGKSA